MLACLHDRGCMLPAAPCSGGVHVLTWLAVPMLAAVPDARTQLARVSCGALHAEAAKGPGSTACVLHPEDSCMYGVLKADVQNTTCLLTGHLLIARALTGGQTSRIPVHSFRVLPGRTALLPIEQALAVLGSTTSTSQASLCSNSTLRRQASSCRLLA